MCTTAKYAAARSCEPRLLYGIARCGEQAVLATGPGGWPEGPEGLTPAARLRMPDLVTTRDGVYFFLRKSSKKTATTLPLGKTSFCPCLSGGVREWAWVVAMALHLISHPVPARTLFACQTGRRFFRRSLVSRLVKPRSGFFSLVACAYAWFIPTDCFHYDVGAGHAPPLQI